MARIQILQLPPYGRDGESPFVLIVDQCTTPLRDEVTPAERFNRGLPVDSPVDFTYQWQAFGKQIGARGVLVTDETVNIVGEESADDVRIEFDHAALLDTISAAVRAHLESTPEHHFQFTGPTLTHERLETAMEQVDRRRRGNGGAVGRVG